jgi:putative oxidoreductase
MLALIFVTSGWGKIGGFEGTAGYIASKGLPMASVVTALTILVELGGGLALVFGFFTRWAALALAVFSVLAGVIFHNYWAVPADQVMNMTIHFWKNISIAGGMLVLAAFGAGSISIDAKQGR